MPILKLGKRKIMRNLIFCVLVVAIFSTTSGFSSLIAASSTNEEKEPDKLDYFIKVTGDRPFGVAFNKGIMYMVTAPASGNGMLSKVTPDGKVHKFAKLEGDFSGDYMEDKSFISSGIDFDKNGNVYITLGDKLLKISPEGKVKKIADGFLRCFDVKLDKNGNIYVADDKADKIYKFSPSMKKSTFYKGKMTGDFILTSLAFDRKYENLYAREGERILKFKINSSGSQVKPVSIANSASIFNICIDKNNNIYACTANSIIRIDQKGKVTNVTDLLLTDPDGMSIGNAGFDPNILYVAEAYGIVKVHLGK